MNVIVLKGPPRYHHNEIIAVEQQIKLVEDRADTAYEGDPADTVDSFLISMLRKRDRGNIQYKFVSTNDMMQTVQLQHISIGW